MKSLLSLFLLFFSSGLSAQTTNLDCKPDTAGITILQFTDYRVRFFDSTYSSATLDKQEYCSFQKILIAFFNDLSDKPIRLFYHDYKIQYIPVVDKNGKKLVLINAFCKNYGGFNGTSWRSELIRPSDGGSCYFLGIADLTEKRIKDLWVNGEASIKKLISEQNDAVCDATEVE